MAKRISWDSITGERVQVEAIKLLSECGCPETAQSKAFQEKAFAKIVKDYGGDAIINMCGKTRPMNLGALGQWVSIGLPSATWPF